MLTESLQLLFTYTFYHTEFSFSSRGGYSRICICLISNYDAY